MPEYVAKMMLALDPSFDKEGQLDYWVGPLFKCRTAMGQWVQQLFVNVAKLIVFPGSFPNLRHFSCAVDEVRSAGSILPALMPAEDDKVSALRRRLVRHYQFRMLRLERNERGLIVVGERA